MKQIQEKLIGESTYRVTQFGAKKGRNLLFTLIRLFGPVMGEAAKSRDIGKIFRAFAESSKEEDFDRVCEAFAESTEILLVAQTAKGTMQVPTPLSKIFDDHFVGKYSEMLEWLIFSAEVNYSSFFGSKGLGGILAGALAQEEQSNSAPPKE